MYVRMYIRGYMQIIWVTLYICISAKVNKFGIIKELKSLMHYTFTDRKQTPTI